MVRLALGADIPDFSIRLRGYDRTEVEVYLHHIRHGKIGARADGSTPSNDHVQSQVNTLLEEARQQAGEIRGKAEGQARSILEHADRQATATPRENADEYARQVRAETQSHAEGQAAELSASQQKQLARLTKLRRDLSDCLLEIGAAAEREPRALVADAGPLTIPGEAEAKAVPPQTRLQTQSAQAGLGWPGPFGEAWRLVGRAVCSSVVSHAAVYCCSCSSIHSDRRLQYQSSSTRGPNRSPEGRLPQRCLMFRASRSLSIRRRRRHKLRARPSSRCLPLPC